MSEPGRVAVITGAGSGIGATVAARLLGEGWHVALAGRREQALAQTASSAAQSPGDALVVPTDVTDHGAVTALFGAVLERWERVDLLFNNAGVFGTPAPIDEFDVDQWRAVVDTNLSGCFYCAQEAFRAMKAQRPQGGRIINNGSISAAVPRPHAVAYTATKHAITGLTRAVALEGRPFQIACGQIDIGNAATELAAHISQGTLQADGSVAAEPMMDLGHAADAVVHMANLPLDANVLFMTIMATAMPFVGRG
ncbi:MAG TPA: SDR family oxidoreductase [Solirubrobacteraceae bacterium]|jgi:NADP-dependent 3-hydroxy acid dehydrogenase YdfG|nr:SDR family oxidoreductase [Solirubrobacteraceae bacterium]